MISWIWQFIQHTSKKLTKFLFGHNIFIISNNELLWSFIQRTNSELSPWPRHWGTECSDFISLFTKQNIQNSANISILSLLESVTYSPTHRLSLTCFPPYFFWQVKKQNKILKANTNAEILGWGRSIEMIHLILLLCYI